MNLLKEFVHSFYPVSDVAFQEFSKHVFIKEYKKKHQIVKLGEITNKFYILLEGITRSYFVDEDGKERTKTIYTPVMASGNLGALVKKAPSELIYECLTDCKIFEGNYYTFLELAKKHHDLTIFYYKILEKVYIREENKILELSMLSATERYMRLKKRSPNIDNLINQYHIASYLNITPVQLSRIKKNLLLN